MPRVEREGTPAAPLRPLGAALETAYYGRMRAFLCATVAVLLLGACATTGGTGFQPVREEAARREAEKPNGKDAEDQPQEKPPAEKPASGAEEEEEEPEYGIRVVTRPSGADVSVNREFVGRSPIIVTDLTPGTYRLAIEKAGFHGEVRWVELTKDTLVVIDADLEPITGFLAVTTEPADAAVHADGEQLDSTVTELPVGEYRLTVRAFGYEPFTRRVSIEDGETTRLHVALETAEFDVEGFSLSRRAFSPTNPGRLGTTRFSFRVTAPGSGSITVLDAEGSAVWTHRFSDFRTWEQGVTWDGRTAEGEPLPDGEYSVLLSAGGEGAGTGVVRERLLIIDRSRGISYRAMLSGSPGLLYAPTPEVLPLGSYQATGTVVGHRMDPAPADGGLTYRFPVQGALRIGLGRRVEAGVQATAFVQDSQDLPFSAGVSVGRLLFSGAGVPALSLGVSAKATYYAGSNTDTLTNFVGAGLALPVLAAVPPLRLVLAPEVFVSPTTVAYGSELPEPGPAVWAYGRAGLFIDQGGYILGASVAGRSRPFSQPLGIAFPLAAGLEAHWMIPGSYAYVSAMVLGEFFASGYYLMAGGSLGFIY